MGKMVIFSQKNIVGVWNDKGSLHKIPQKSSGITGAFTNLSSLNLRKKYRETSGGSTNTHPHIFIGPYGVE
jgi:hypothetical protein